MLLLAKELDGRAPEMVNLMVCQVDAAAAHAVGVGVGGRGGASLMAEGCLQVWSGDAKKTGQAGIYQVVGVHRLDVTGSRLQP